MKKIILISSLLVASILTAQVITDHKSLTFTWEKSEDFNNVSEYRLYYKQASEDEYIEYVAIAGSEDRGVVQNLIPNTEYTAVVKAANKDGESGPSNEVFFTTKGFYDAPGDPENLEIEISVQVTVITNNINQ